MLYGSYCYGNGTVKMDYSSAEFLCQNVSNGWLVTIDNMAENDFLCEQFDCRQNSYWIGYHDTSGTGDFQWTQPSSSEFVNWGFDMPSEPDLTPRCAKLERYDGGEWADSSCSQTVYPLCESFSLTHAPSSVPSGQPTGAPTGAPTSPTGEPTAVPTAPSAVPSTVPSGQPSTPPSSPPSISPSNCPSNSPSSAPSNGPSSVPTQSPVVV